MNNGGLAQMSHGGYTSPPGMGMPAGGLASRRGGQNIKPLSFDAIKASDPRDTGLPTARTPRSHMLAGLRTAPKSAAAASYAPSPTTTTPPLRGGRNNSIAGNMYGSQENMYNGPKTSMPRMSSQSHSYNNSVGMNQQINQQMNQHQQMSHQQMSHQQQQQQQQQQMNQQHYTPEQILAPPELNFDEQLQDQMDPSLYAQLVATNMYLAQQQQRLQQQLLQVQAAAQQFQGLSLSGSSALQQQMVLQNLYQQQQQLQSLQQSMVSPMASPRNVYAYYDSATGQQSYYVDQAAAAQQAQGYMDQIPATPQAFMFQQETVGTPRVQVSPPPMENSQPTYRTVSPPKKMELMAEPEPLPPPSANAFRRGHKKTSSSLANSKNLSLFTEDGSPATGPKTASFPLTPMTGGYGPGQNRAGEHPLRQPRGPPSIEELKAKPTSKEEGSKNFVTRTRRVAVNNLVRAGMERRKGTSSSCGSMSPVSESAEEVITPLTDHGSESGRSGSGSLSGDAEPSLASSRTSASISWGAIGSDRPGSRQKTRKSVDSLSSASESDGSFASVFKHGPHHMNKTKETVDGQRKAPMLVLTNAEKRKGGVPVA